MKEIIITACQIDIKLGEIEENYNKIENLLRKSAENKTKTPQLIIFPECTLTGYCFTTVEELIPVAKQTDKYIGKLQRICNELNIYSIIGFVEYVNSDTMYNSAAVLGPDNFNQIYRKVHLPNTGLDNFNEVMPSNRGFEPIVLPFATIGVIICYDHGFPESGRVLALGGAELIVAIVNWAEGVSGPDIVQSRAIDNGIAYIALNRVGEEGEDTFIGNSSIVDGNGKILERLGKLEEIVKVKLSLENERGNANEWHPINNRRPSLYTKLVE